MLDVGCATRDGRLRRSDDVVRVMRLRDPLIVGTGAGEEMRARCIAGSGAWCGGYLVRYFMSRLFYVLIEPGQIPKSARAQKSKAQQQGPGGAGLLDAATGQRDNE